MGVSGEKLSVYIVEDDPGEREALEKTVLKRSGGFGLAGATAYADVALSEVTKTLPHAVVLDLELHQGGGDGIEFLKALKEIHLARRPFILVSTNNTSSVILSTARDYGANFIMLKTQKGYCAEYVVDFLAAAKHRIIASAVADKEEPPQPEELKRLKVWGYLAGVGIKQSVLGYNFLTEAIIAAADDPQINFVNMLADRYGKAAKSISRDMQTAINKAWTRGDPAELVENYTGYVSSGTGVPTVTEFVLFYARKLKYSLKSN